MKITDISLNTKLPLYTSYIDIWRGINYHTYIFKTLTQYQRAVRLLNAFVERNMK